MAELGFSNWRTVSSCQETTEILFQRHAHHFSRQASPSPWLIHWAARRFRLSASWEAASRFMYTSIAIGKPRYK
jgi:hypothetical protein